MDVAEDIRHSFSRKQNRLARSGLIKAQIKPFPFKEREHIVVERIGIRKLHRRSYWNHLQVRDKHAVLLQQYVLLLREERRDAGFPDWREPCDAGHGAIFSRK